MQSVQTMRWILVNLSAVAALVALFLGYWPATAILLLGVAAHTAHWQLRERGGPVGEPVPAAVVADEG